MNQNTINNSGLQQLNSFVMNNVKAVNNSLKAANNSIKNTVSNAVSDITEPIMNSMNSTIENTPSPMVSIPIIITLGVLIISFILVVMFRSQITQGFELLWEKIRQFMGWSIPSPTPPPFVPDNMFPQSGGAAEKILPRRKEVFNIAENKYAFSDAEPLCKAFGAELATYDQVKEAWNKGADWCNYGWVKGQAAVYPTQESTFNKLQQGPEDERMACGTTGVNGGYFDNPELRFGVNCYGVKPSESENDIKNIMSENGPLTPGALAFDKKVLDYKAHMGEIPVNPFKEGTWTE
jgi:hypothetical protein